MRNCIQLGAFICHLSLPIRPHCLAEHGSVYKASDEYEAGSSGGEATHKLTVSEMPSHGHNYSQFVYYNTIPTNYTDAYLTGMGRAFSITTGATTAVGSGVAHNNMPPYLAVYMWRRIS